VAAAKPIREDAGETRPANATPAEGANRLTPLRELQLVDKYRKGGAAGHEALCELVRGYQKRIYSICARMVRHRDDAADLTQEALIKVIEGLPSYNGQSKLSTWVIRVAMNCCLSHIRREKLRAHESLSVGGTSDADGGMRSDHHAAGASKRGFSASSQSREPSPLQRVQQQQNREVILNALAGVDPDMRAILVLRDLQDLDYQQLAEVLEIPIGTVKSRLFRARAALRHEIETRGGV
jgi:RNA polymerase sigma-70 factor (ECF subfamily)